MRRVNTIRPTVSEAEFNSLDLFQNVRHLNAEVAYTMETTVNYQILGLGLQRAKILGYREICLDIKGLIYYSTI